MKKIVSLVLFTAMLVSLFVFPTSAAAWNGTDVSASLAGEGTAASPYLVASAADLAFLAKSVADGTDYAGKYITQTADIDLGGKEWTPIGTSSKPFAGVYDGKFHKIVGLSITKDQQFTGLFGYIKTIGVDAGICNLTLDGSVKVDNTSLDGHGVGALVGWVYQDSTQVEQKVYITNITNNADVEIKSTEKQPRVGTVAGYAFIAVFENVVNNGNLTVNATGAKTVRAGGIVGQTNRTTYKNCVNNGNVTVTNDANSAASGIAAITTAKYDGDNAIGPDTVFDNCVNNGKIEVTNTKPTVYAAGVAANPYSPKTSYKLVIKNCVNNGEIIINITNSADYGYAGGILGYANKSGVAIENCVSTVVPVITAGEKSNPGGIAGVINKAGDDTAYMKDCKSVGKVVGWSANQTDYDNSTADLEVAEAKKAAKALEKNVAPSTEAIGGFATGYVKPVTPSPAPMGDATTLVVLLAVVSLAAVVVVKKASAR